MNTRALLLAIFAIAVVVLAIVIAGCGAETDDQPTAPPMASVIAAAGDIACDPDNPSFADGEGTADACRQRFTAELLAGRDLAAVLALGDLQYEDATLSKFEASYEPSWGELNEITRPVPGNHEYNTADAAGYFDYFNGEGAVAGPAGARGRGWYSYDVGSWHLIALNSNCAEVGGCAEGSPQNDWLEDDLAANPATCVLGYWHHPRFSSGAEHGDSPRVAPFWDDLYAAGADVVLSGHDHLYERFAPQRPNGAPDPDGIRQFIVGTGGDNFYDFGEVVPNSEVRQADSFGVLELTLLPDGYDWRFLPEADSEFTDSGSDRC